MNRLIAVMLGACLVCAQIQAQPFHREVASIPVSVKGRTIELPFTGGMNSPVYRFVDIDNDSDLDLFLFDNDLNTDFYRNTGSASLARFELQAPALSLPRISIWFHFADLDGDGLSDLLTDTAGTFINFHRNAGSPATPRFVLQEGPMKDTAGIPIFAGTNSLPAFVDVDADGDMDFFSTNSLNGTFNFYRNIGTPLAPKFAFVTDIYEGISVIGDSCLQGGVPPAGPDASSRHGASAIGFADLDGNGTPDLYLGDLFSHIVFEIRNTGAPSSPRLECASNHFPDESPVQSSGFNVCSFHDIDNDGDLDMFVSVLAGIVERNGFWYLENTGDSVQHAFALRTKEYLSVLDVGQSAHPVLADIDADGDQDILAGSSDGLLWLFLNSGTPTAPVYVCNDTLYGGISGGYTSAPALTDIDADGDLDLFVGGFNGRIDFYRNDGSAVSPHFARETFPTDTISVFQYASPAFADIDGDLDEDLFIGDAGGFVSFYRNDGDSTLFFPVFVTASFTAVNVGERASPFISDLDADGDPDMLVGAGDGSIRLYRNDGTPRVASFVLAEEHFAATDPMADCIPAMADIDGDGDLDLLAGTKKGGIHFYRNDLMTGVREHSDLPGFFTLAQNFPNPFNPMTTIRFELQGQDFVRIRVFDIFGRLVTLLAEGRMQAGIHDVRFDGSNLGSGVYYCQLETTGGNAVRRMMLIK